MELVWSPAALDDIIAATDYIRSELASPMAARRFADSVLKHAQLFADVPSSGTVLRTLNGINTDYRYVVSGNWMIFFVCDEVQAVVVRVLYAKSDYMKTLFGEMGD